MGFLKRIEKRMGSLVEGVFGRAFKRQVHPVEMAKGVTKQMDDGRMVSISRTYAPNDFTIHLSGEDNESVRAYLPALRDELIQYASTHARNKSYHLMTPPQIRFTVEETLRFGEFGVTAKMTGGDGPREKGAPEDTSGQTRIFRSEQDTNAPPQEKKPQDTAAISPEDARRQGLSQETVELVLGDASHPIAGAGPWSIGRSAENEVVISDPNISRKHARLSRADSGFVIEDLGSTNGTYLGGAPISRERIDDGDELAFGEISARFIRRTDRADDTGNGEPSRTQVQRAGDHEGAGGS